MIHDTLNSVTTRLLELRIPVLKQAFDWLRSMPAEPPEGIIELQGCDMYVNVHGYQTLPAAECQWESHRHTVDIQYCIAGGEIIEWLPTGVLTSLDDYFPAKDTEHWQDNGEQPAQLRMTPGAYVMFLPQELHRPKIMNGNQAHIKKLVIKIQNDLLQNCLK